MSTPPVIQTDALGKVYKHPFFWWVVRARALRDLTMQVETGEVFGLLGPNGSGKSTTIKLLLGLIFPTTGRASVFGRRPDDLSIKHRIGYLPEESYLYRFLDAEETLDFYGRLFHIPRQERRHRIEALLDLTGLRHERRRPIGEFSKGMARRIGLAQTLINDPELVILDEPTTGLDPMGTREVKDIILHLREKRKTVILSSHLLADVEDVCDRVTILYGGRVRAAGTVDQLLSRQEVMQITAPMSPALAARMAERIRAELGGDVPVEIAPPRERLESLFLRIVKEAQEQGVETSGAGASSHTIDFLTERQEDDLLVTLSKSDAKTAPVPLPVASSIPEGGGETGRGGQHTSPATRTGQIADVPPGTDAGRLADLVKETPPLADADAGAGVGDDVDVSVSPSPSASPPVPAPRVANVDPDTLGKGMDDDLLDRLTRGEETP